MSLLNLGSVDFAHLTTQPQPLKLYMGDVRFAPCKAPPNRALQKKDTRTVQPSLSHVHYSSSGLIATGGASTRSRLCPASASSSAAALVSDTSKRDALEGLSTRGTSAV